MWKIKDFNKKREGLLHEIHDKKWNDPAFDIEGYSPNIDRVDKTDQSEDKHLGADEETKDISKNDLPEDSEGDDSESKTKPKVEGNTPREKINSLFKKNNSKSP